MLPPLIQRLLLDGGDLDIGAELLLCMQYHGVRTAEYWRGLDYLLSAQNPSGAWGRYEHIRYALGAWVDQHSYLHTSMLVQHALLVAFERAGFYEGTVGRLDQAGRAKAEL